MDLLSQVDKSLSEGKLSDMNHGYNYPKPVPGRVVHIDADFMAYQVSAESKAELDPEDPTPRKSLEDMQHNARRAVEHIMQLGGGTSFHVHTTPSGSTKGGRGDQAVLKEYQANRKDRDNKPEFLDTIRAYLISEIGAGGNGTAHLDQEADDGMSQAAYQALGAGTPELCVIASADKDLRMCPGYLLVNDKLDLLEDTFGWIELDRSKSSAKVVGRGTKFFWAQLLMGDAADNISGVPKVTGNHICGVKPTKAYTTAIQKLGTGTDKEDARHNKVIDAELAKVKPCGPAMTYDLLANVTNDREAFERVKAIWVDLGKSGYEFEHWRTGQVVSPTQAMFGDMQTLWMRRNKNPRDVLDWLKEKLNADD
ncbi:exonuclease [Phage MedPE-SWcel-C56]|uniref:5'-3' exonuclease domain-containing protein n=1 Tax=Phage MedPE-SWcel-C56 TaxID=1871314 RepID=A0A1B1IY21_9CAUD|nr:exonuclease [Phage MedPE-SWcel-C56]ANS06222.1 hypothetical protein [Phage MedPE-SWcel-C56]